MQSVVPLYLYQSWLQAEVSDQMTLAEWWREVLALWLQTHLEEFGTSFQARVWGKIAEIPLGQTVSYAGLAAALGKPTAYRAVANACGTNPWPFVIPCHRVVASHFTPGSDRALGGYGLGVKLKRKLLWWEQNQ
jgi:AraC family transcriptional regulator of adaptative response/methylated-DNA-[protein]-cysteine methyltransferase